MATKKYTVRLAGNAWSDTIANVLNRYESGQSVAPDINLHNTVKLPAVNIQMTDDTKKLVRFVGIALAAAIAFEGYARLTK